MGLNLTAIREALAAQVAANIDRGTNVYPQPVGAPVRPCVTVTVPDDGYVAYFGTFGANGEADILLDLTLDVDGPQPSVHIALDDYLSAGQGNGSSIVDAVHADRTLGGVVGNIVCLTAGGRDEQDDGSWRTVLRVEIIVNKIGANT